MLFQLTGDFGGPPAVAPDGRSVAFAAVDPLGKRQIWIRRLDTLTPEVLPLPAHGEGSFDEGGMRVVWAEVPLASAASAAQAVHAAYCLPSAGAR